MVKQPIRVLEIISGFAVEGPLGGLERYGMELVKALPPTIEPTLLGMWAYGTPTEDRWLQSVQQAGIQALMPAPWDEQHPFASFLATLRATRAALRGQRFDIIHSHCQFGDPLALLLKRPLGARVLMRTVHQDREWMRRPLRRLVMSNGLALLAFDAEAGVSRQVVEALDRRPLARLRGRRAYLLHNALRLERFQQRTTPAERAPYRRRLGIPDTALLIGSVGRLEPQKGFSVLIEAMGKVVERFPQAHLVLVGDGSLAEELKIQASHSSAAEQIHLPGSLSPIEPFFGSLDLFVSSSLWEGLATVLLEAIAMEVPIVGTAISGTTELIEAGVTGWLAPPKDAAALAEAIIAALADKAARRRVVAAARGRLPRFDIINVAARHAAIYQQLLLRRA